MHTRVVCPFCEKPFRVRESSADLSGRTVRCPLCDGRGVIPGRRNDEFHQPRSPDHHGRQRVKRAAYQSLLVRRRLRRKQNGSRVGTAYDHSTMVALRGDRRIYRLGHFHNGVALPPRRQRLGLVSERDRVILGTYHHRIRL